jgi:predicted Zn-dependent protease
VKLRLIAFLFIVCCFTAAPAQLGKPTKSSDRTAVGEATVRGVVVMSDGSSISEPVKVTLKVLRGDQYSTYTDRDGRFELPHIAPGDYSIEVEADRSRDRFEITNDKLTVRTNTPNFITLTLREKQKTKEVRRDKTVSVAMLDQKVPPAARHEFDNATRLAREGKSEESIAALQRAIAIYPEYLMALNDLGAQLLEAGRLDEALTTLKTATKIDPNSFNPQLNLGIVMVRQKAFTAALTALDHALSLEPSSPAAHLYAGLAASGENDTVRAERELKSAFDLGGHSFAVTLVYLGRLYIKRGDKQRAIETLEQYLQEDPSGSNVPLVKKMLADLK